MRRKQETRSHSLQFALSPGSGADRHRLVVALMGLAVSLTALAVAAATVTTQFRPAYRR